MSTRCLLVCFARNSCGSIIGALSPWGYRFTGDQASASHALTFDVMKTNHTFDIVEFQPIHGN